MLKNSSDHSVSSVEFCKLKLPNHESQELSHQGPKGDTRTQGPPATVDLFQNG